MREVQPPGDARERFSGAERKEDREKHRRPGRLLAVFKGLVMLVLLTVTAYGMLNAGLYRDMLWLPVAAGILVLLFVTLFVRGFYWDLPSVGILLVGLLAALVVVKGLSMVWTISETETIKEMLRSSMYLATFLMAVAALTSGRQVGPLIDVSIIIVAAVAGYGLLQKISPIEYPVRSLDGVRMDSTLEYSNTTAVILGMGVVLALARMGTLRNFVLRGLYAAITLSFLIALYLTVSRGGIGSLGIGLIVLLVLGSGRLRMLADLLLLSLPGAWLWWQMQSLPGLLGTGVLRQQKIDDGILFRNDLILALLVAFALQAAYAFLANRYELASGAKRWLGILVVAGGVIAVVLGALVVANMYGGPEQAYAALVGNANETENVGQRLVSLDISSRGDYWMVAWEAWKERPFTGTGAGTFQYTWLEDRPGFKGVKQVHNVYLEQGTETGLFAFLALLGFVTVLVGYTGRAAWRSGQQGERRLLLAGLGSTLLVYLVSSAFEWHWYLPASTLFFFLLAAVAVKFASREDWGAAEAPADGETERPTQHPR
ncbi:MAG: O-antigen ligase family protein [Rubrobacter sp.]|nr:O-antigen ligase family protein [Rubrobacteraceae bacterium]MDQ3437318.1 O-antigen ligase family protein [Actinomycetota bacterium]